MKKKNSSLFTLHSSLEVIDNYVADNLLAIDPEKPVAVISWRLHLMYSDKLARWPWRWLCQKGFVERDVRYRRLMKMVSLYVNLLRGKLQSDYEARLIIAGTDRAEAHRQAREKYGTHNGPLHFIVTGTDNEPLLLGTYDNDRIGFVEAPSDKSLGHLDNLDNLEKNRTAHD